MSPSSAFPDPTTLAVVEVRPAGGHLLRIAFSDGRSGRHDFSDLAARRGPMVSPLADPAFLGRAFVEDGVLTWPNGYDWDTAALWAEMSAAGELSVADAAE